MKNIPTRTHRDELTGSVADSSQPALGTLAADKGILSGGPSMTRGGTMISVRGSMAIRSVTPGDGPWLVGVMNVDLSLAELEEYLETDGPLHPDDTTAVEVSSRGRKIRQLGVIVPQGDGSVGGIHFSDKALSGLRFSEEAGGWSWWLYNLGKAMSTGAIWKNTLQVFVRWNRGG